MRAIQSTVVKITLNPYERSRNRILYILLYRNNITQASSDLVVFVAEYSYNMHTGRVYFRRHYTLIYNNTPLVL